MRMPNFENFIHWAQSFALIICGMIIGAAVFMSVTHHHLETEIKKSKALKEEINDLLATNEALDKYKNKQTVIKSVNVKVLNKPDDNELDEVIVSEIRKEVEADLKVLKGKPISYIEQDPYQIREVYGARLKPNIHGKDYEIEIQTLLVIYGELTVWVSAKEYIRQPT